MSQQEIYQKQLMMFRRAAPIPAIPLPEGWSIRPMVPGEGAEWVRIAQSVGFVKDDGQDAEALWLQVMGNDPLVKTENVLFACDASGRPVATATARFAPEDMPAGLPAVEDGLGYLHFVAALPECQGVGAGSAVTAAVLKRFEELGLHSCVLTTDDFRLPAIKSYLRLGWVPVLHAPDMPARWEIILYKLGYAGGIAAIDSCGKAARIG